MLENVLIVDTETTDLDPRQGALIEVGAVLFSLQHVCMIECYSALIESDAPNPVESINHIPEGAYTEWGMGAPTVWERVSAMAIDCQAIVAHNADFDRDWLRAQPGTDALTRMPWIDTCYGVTWPLQGREGSSLINLAFDHGLGVVAPHRALSDCLLIARLLEQCHRMGRDVEAILQRGLRPMGVFEADVPYARRQEAKDTGFKWKKFFNRDKQGWVRKLAIEDADPERFGFPLLRRHYDDIDWLS